MSAQDGEYAKVVTGLSSADQATLKSLEQEYATKNEALVALYRTKGMPRKGKEVEEENAFFECQERFEEFEKAHPAVAALKLKAKIEADVKGRQNKIKAKEANEAVDRYFVIKDELNALQARYKEAIEQDAELKKAKVELEEEHVKRLRALEKEHVLKHMSASELERLQALEKESETLIRSYGYAIAARNNKKTDAIVSRLSAGNKEAEKLSAQAQSKLESAKEKVSRAGKLKLTARKFRRSARVDFRDAYEDYGAYADYAYDAYANDLGGQYYQSALSDSAEVMSTSQQAVTAEYVMAISAMAVLIAVISIVLLLCGCLCGVFFGRKYHSYQQARKREIVNDNNELFE